MKLNRLNGQKGSPQLGLIQVFKWKRSRRKNKRKERSSERGKDKDKTHLQSNRKETTTSACVFSAFFSVHCFHVNCRSVFFSSEPNPSRNDELMGWNFKKLNQLPLTTDVIFDHIILQQWQPLTPNTSKSCQFVNCKIIKTVSCEFVRALFSPADPPQ